MHDYNTIIGVIELRNDKVFVMCLCLCESSSLEFLYTKYCKYS